MVVEEDLLLVRLIILQVHLVAPVLSLSVIIENKIKISLSLYFRGRDLFLYLKHIYNQVNKLIDRGETPL